MGQADFADKGGVFGFFVVMEQRLNESLRKEITALNQASDAWKRAATPTVFSRLRGAVPYIVVGAGAVLLLR